MSFEFNADEIFEMAEQLERDGAQFYRQAAQRGLDPKAKHLLLSLAELEDEHRRVVKEMRAELAAEEQEAQVFDPEDEGPMYLRAFVETRVFFQKTVDASSVSEILKAGIEAERDSIVFYLGMRDLVPERLGKERVEEIIKQEMLHLRQLSEELRDKGAEL